MKGEHVVGNKRPGMVITWPFISFFFGGSLPNLHGPQATSEFITFEPIKIKTHSASQNDHMNLSFVKDKHSFGKKMARKNPTIVVYQYLSFPIRVYDNKFQDHRFETRALKFGCCCKILEVR